MENAEEPVIPGEGQTRLDYPLTWPAKSSVLWEIEKCNIKKKSASLGIQEL